MHTEKYYFCVEESMQGEIEPTWGKIEMNIKTTSQRGVLGSA